VGAVVTRAGLPAGLALVTAAGVLAGVLLVLDRPDSSGIV
jgi:hypothetical protein